MGLNIMTLPAPKPAGRVGQSACRLYPSRVGVPAKSFRLRHLLEQNHRIYPSNATQPHRLQRSPERRTACLWARLSPDPAISALHAMPVLAALAESLTVWQ